MRACAVTEERVRLSRLKGEEGLGAQGDDDDDATQAMMGLRSSGPVLGQV